MSEPERGRPGCKRGTALACLSRLAGLLAVAVAMVPPPTADADVVTLSVTASGFATSASSATLAASAATDATMEADFVNRISALRARKGLRPLVVDAELTAIGRRWALSMSKNGLKHNANFQNEVTQDWELLGENVGTGPDVATIMQAFIDSPTHYKNLVEPRFQEIGVGVVISADGRVWTAHQFMELRTHTTPAPTKATAPKPATRPPPTATRPTTSTTALPPPPQVPARIVLVLEALRALDADRFR
ncbi:MAG TPA: CAP domain-containing protein [Acidimicrobiales bacterium]|nr:CAP domain-containing protein [Acidimicrobiales bacterium]